jgi:hypothetical protein
MTVLLSSGDRLDIIKLIFFFIFKHKTENVGADYICDRNWVSLRAFALRHHVPTVPSSDDEDDNIAT